MGLRLRVVFWEEIGRARGQNRREGRSIDFRMREFGLENHPTVDSMHNNADAL